jgi:amidohydrolase
MINSIKTKAEALFPELLRIRHHIHAHPELSFQEFNTSAFIADELDKLGISYQKGLAGTGIVATIEGKNPGKRCIALRADMDALPITEANQTPYKSQNDGIMHACGHDVHSTCLIGVATLLKDMSAAFEGTFKLIFQPGEEMHPGGASLLIKEGVLENPAPEAILALHVYPHLPTGIVGFREGQYMASSDEIHIEIEGRGGHAALPHQTIDPIVVAAQMITALQQVVSRKNNPLMPTVLSFGKISGGNTHNVIPDKVEIWGTLRTFDEQWRAEACSHIKTIATQVASAFGANAKVHIPEGGYPSLYNNPELTRLSRSFAEQYLGMEQVRTLDLRMAAEDFSFYTQHTKGCFFRLGTNDNNERFTAPVHNAHFDINENALKVGTGIMTWIALNVMNHPHQL